MTVVPRDMKRIALALAAVFAVLGLSFGYLPVSSGGVSCGSAFVRSDAAKVADLANTLTGGAVTIAGEHCDSLRSVLRIPAIAFIVLAAGSLFAVGVATGRGSAVP